jgi:1-acyl-sn-glycerol-3-phosphate acyltransferase
MRLVYKLIFYVIGWKIKGSIPKDCPKYVLIVAPHTSNWDFFLGLAVRSIKKMDTKYLAKKELFKGVSGKIFKALGGYPVDRSKNTNFVDAVADLFENNDRFSIAITPEGTRKYVAKWKTGFYYIALKAKVPLIMASLNYRDKVVEFSPPFNPSGDLQTDLKEILAHYKKIPGKNPENGVR